MIKHFMNKRFGFLMLVIGGLFFIASCKSTRSTLKRPIKEHGFYYLYNKMIENQVNFDYLSAKFNVVYYQGKKKTDLRGQFRIRKDSLTWVSLSPALGIEAARITLSNDSVKYINRLNKTFSNGNAYTSRNKTFCCRAKIMSIFAIKSGLSGVLS